MNDFLKITAIVLIVLILGIFVKNQRSEISLILVIAASCMVLVFVAINYISPVLEFLKNIYSSSGLHTDMVMVLIKTTGIGLICEIVNLICTDAGFGALGKTLKFTSVFVIIYLSIPLINELLTLINKVLMSE